MLFRLLLVAGVAAAAQLNPRIAHSDLFRRQSDSCAADGLAVCESSCMPLDGVCCDDGSSTYCDSGNYCVPGGCCETGETCSGGGGTITNIISGPTSTGDTSEPSSTFDSSSASTTSADSSEPSSTFDSGSFSTTTQAASEPTTTSGSGSGSGSGSSTSTCLATQSSCGTGCMPLLATCCDATQGNYCNDGEYCVSNGCCPVGKTCNGDSKSSSPGPVYSQIGAIKLTYIYVFGSLAVAGFWLLQ